MLEVSLKKQPAGYWLKVLHEARVPVAPILNVAESAGHPQTKARNMIVGAGGFRLTGNPIKISGYDVRRYVLLPQHSIKMATPYVANSAGSKCRATSRKLTRRACSRNAVDIVN